MAEVLVEFDRPVTADGASYRARAVGRRADDGMWEAWLEFLPGNGDAPVVGSVETRQPEHEHAVYWATGLTPIFLEGALARALHPLTVRVRVAPEPVSDAPAPRSSPPARAAAGPEAVLDPFEVGGRSLDILRQELTALNRPRLLNIIAAFDLNPADEDLAWMSDGQLATFIVTATETRLARRP